MTKTNRAIGRKTPTRSPLLFAPKPGRAPKGRSNVNLMPVKNHRAADVSAAANIRTVTLTVMASTFIDPRKKPGEMIREDAQRMTSRLVAASIDAQNGHGVSVRTIRFSLKDTPNVIKQIEKHHGVKPERAAAIFGDEIERLAAALSAHFAAEHERLTPIDTGALHAEAKADRERDVFVLVEMPAMETAARAVEAIDMVMPLVSGHPHMFVGLTMSAPGQPAILAAITAAASMVSRLGTDGGRVGVNYLPEEDGPFYPAVRPTVPGALTVGVANADVLTSAILAARRLGADAARIEEALEDAHAAFLARAGQVGRAIADACGFVWSGVSAVSAPVNATLMGLPPARWSSWRTMEALEGDVVDSGNVVPATARFNACLWRGAVRSGELLKGPRGSFAPPAEDGLLAQRVRDGQITVGDLVVQQTVSSVGTDMAVLDPSTSAQQIADLLTTIAAMSMQLSKPLTARLIVPPHDCKRMPNGDVHLGGLLGAAPCMKLARARDESGTDARVATLAGAMQESRQEAAR